MDRIFSLILIACTAAALAAANSGAAAIYFQFLNFQFFGISVLHWINDGLMAIFFFSVGMEIRREIHEGELSTKKKAALPVFAALGGMIAPAIIYLCLNWNGEGEKGWAIPMATDIAFAVGVLSFLGKKIPLSLRIFLLSLAVADDVGSILVIATVYANQVHWSTLAGLALGIMLPKNFRFLLEILHPWVNFLIMPAFAFANAGIPIDGLTADSIAAGVFFGLLFGKPLGIMLASFAACKLGLASLPARTKWRHIFGVSVLAGIGFTMAIFIANLSLNSEQAVSAKAAILLASLVSAIIGYISLRLTFFGQTPGK